MTEYLPNLSTLQTQALIHPHISPSAAAAAADDDVPPPLTLAPALSPVHCPLCTFQSIFWQPATQYDATAHTEHFFSGMPVAPHDQQLFLGLPTGCRVPPAVQAGDRAGAEKTAADAARDGVLMRPAAVSAGEGVEKESDAE